MHDTQLFILVSLIDTKESFKHELLQQVIIMWTMSTFIN